MNSSLPLTRVHLEMSATQKIHFLRNTPTVLKRWLDRRNDLQETDNLLSHRRWKESNFAARQSANP